MSAQDLLDAAREHETREPLRGLDALLATPREFETITVEVAVGNVLGQIAITELSGWEWAELWSRAWPPRPGVVEDLKVGFGCNVQILIAEYPVSRITVDGSIPTAEQWRELCDLIGAPAWSDLAAALWWMHVGQALESKQVLLDIEARAKKKEAGHG